MNLIQTLRKPKIFGMAIFDWVMTFLGSYLLTYLIYTYYHKYDFTTLYTIVTIKLVILGIFMHWILGVKTMLGYYLGINSKPLR